MKKALFILFVISLWACLPLFAPGFFVTDDGDWMIIRFSAFYASLHDGQFPIRFLHRLNFDYGYPVATFLYPGFMYFGIPLHVLKFGFVETIKIILGLSLIGSTIFTYFWLSNVFQRKIAAMVGAVFSLYIPYHLYDVYMRGSVGEIFALLWVPFILWMVERRSIFFISIGIFFLVISHNIIALLFLPLLFLYAFLRNLQSIRQLLISFVLGISLSSFFIIPALYELRFTNFSQTTISDPFKYFADLQLIGFSTIIIFILSLVMFIVKRKSLHGKKLISLFLIVVGASIFFSSSLSSHLWPYIPSSLIQFPFRLLSYLIIGMAFLSAFIIAEMKSAKKFFTALVLVGLCIFSALPYTTPRIALDRGEGYYFTNDATTTVHDEYMPAWVKNKPVRRAQQKAQIIRGEGEIQNIVYSNKNISFTIDTKTNATILVNTLYWPGWKATLDNKEVPILYNNPNGLMELETPPGKQQVHLRFEETPIRLLSDFISLFSFVILVFLVRKHKIKN